MRLFAITSNVPYRYHDRRGVTSIHVFTYALLDALLDQGHQIVLQIMFNEIGKNEFEQSEDKANRGFSAEEDKELDQLRQRGVAVLAPIFAKSGQPSRQPANVPLPARVRQQITRLISARKVDDYYPTTRFHELICQRIVTSNAQVIIALCSPEGLAATHGFHAVPKISYQGDVDFVPDEVRLRHPDIFGHKSNFGVSVHRLRQELGLLHFKQAHLALMEDVDVIANLTASNALFYSQHQHPRSVYARNTWPDFYKNRVSFATKAGSPNVAGRATKIIGHLGYLNRTGSSFGLRFLMKSLPEIDRIMADLNYQIHIIGGGEIASGLRPYMNYEHLVWQGYVKDLDNELESSDIFLLLNNAGPYQAAFTRHLVAWSMGLCLIVHANSVKAIPEIVHMENALVVSNAAELAQSIFRAATNDDLNRRIRQGGRATYEKYFTPQAVAGTLSDIALDLVAHDSH